MTSPDDPAAGAGALAPESPSSASAPPAPSAPLGPPAGQRRRRARRLLTLAVLIVVGLAALGGGAVALIHEMTRKATKAEVAAAVSQEIATRWRRLPAGKIFPAKVTYLNAQGNNTTATLVGIAPPTSCRAALTPSSFQQIRSLGCSDMLRATYVNAAQTFAATVAIGVMPSVSAASRALSAVDTPLKPTAGLTALGFSGTITSSFGNADRGAAAINASSAPYIFLYTAGYLDGMPGSAAQGSAELPTMGLGILTSLETTMSSHGNPCTMKDIHC